MKTPKYVLLCMPVAGHARAIVTNNATEVIGINILKSSLIRHGIKAKCLSNETKENILSNIESTNPDIVGFSVTWINKDVCETLSMHITEHFPNIQIVWGGPGVSFESVKLVEELSCVDILVVGEGHDTIVEIAKSTSSSDLSRIAGIVYRNGDRILTTPQRAGISDMNDMPDPNRDELLDMIKMKGVNTARILSSWGCPYSCTFCINDQWTKLCRNFESPKRLTKNIGKVADEIQHLTSIGIKNFIFVDEDAIGVSKMDRKRIDQLIDKIEKFQLDDISYSIFTTVNSIIKYPELYKKFANIGLKKIFIGVENVSKNGLNVLGGHVKSSIQNLDFLYKFMKDIGVCPTSGFILLTPFTSVEDVRENISYFRGTESIDLAAFSSFLFRKVELYPGTLLYDKYINDNHPYKSPLDYEFKDPSLETVSMVLDKAWKKVFHVEVALHRFKEMYYWGEMTDDECLTYIRLINKLSDHNISFIEELLEVRRSIDDPDQLVNDYYSMYVQIFSAHKIFAKENAWNTLQLS